MDDQGFPVNCYAFSASLPYQFHGPSPPCHISTAGPLDSNPVKAMTILYRSHEQVMDRMAKGNGVEPVTFEMAAARQQESDRLGGRVGMFVLVELLTVPPELAGCCKLVAPQLKENWDLAPREYRYNCIHAMPKHGHSELCILA